MRPGPACSRCKRELKVGDKVINVQVISAVNPSLTSPGGWVGTDRTFEVTHLVCTT